MASRNYKQSNYGELFIELTTISEFNLKTIKSRSCEKHEQFTDNVNFDLQSHHKTELRQFLEKLAMKEAKYPDGTEADYIISFMSNLGEEVCKQLQNKHEMFHQCYLLKSGSIFEGLKVGKPDEFDFMVILPYFADDRNVKFKPDNHPEFLTWSFVDKDSTMNDVFLNINEVLDEIILSVLPADRWTLSHKFSGAFGAVFNIAHTRTIRYQGETFKDLKIDVDFCFSVPLNKVTVWKSALDYPWKAILRECNENVFYILFNEKCRISFSYYEKNIVNEFPLNSNPKILLRLLKVLRDKYVSKIFDEKSRSMTSLLSTYLLKTLIYYSIRATPCKNCWAEKSLDELVIEQLIKLQDTVRKGELNNFFVPKYNLIHKLSGVRQDLFCSVNASLDEKAFEKWEQLSKDLNNLIIHLSSLHNNEKTALSKLNEIEAQFLKTNETCLEIGLKDELLCMLYYYAYNGADDEKGLKTIINFVNECLPNMEIIGEGYQLVLKDHERIVDIDDWLTRIYGSDDNDKPFQYFPISKENQ